MKTKCNLVIVESAAKAKTIAAYLNAAPLLSHLGTFVVTASYGHITEIPVKTLGVDVNTWEATYEPMCSKSKIISNLKKAVKSATTVYLASDGDNEGEAIAWHLQRTLSLNPTTCNRITFNEITPSALTHAILNPGRINQNIVFAQETRRILDRIVGYELSPLLWRRFVTVGLSAGRVQSAALKMLVQRAQDAQLHESSIYWTMDAQFDLPYNYGKNGSNSEPLTMSAYNTTDSERITWISDKDVTKALENIKQLNHKNWIISHKQVQTKSNPHPPFTTSTLQQHAYDTYKMPAKRTMQLAQALYEAGHITYMRTDSVYLSDDARAGIHAFVKQSIGINAVESRDYNEKKESSGAHEAVRPTDPCANTLSITDDITRDHVKLYESIWRRTIACQMIAALYSERTYIATNKKHASGPIFKGKRSILVSAGYLAIYAPEKHIVSEHSNTDVIQIPTTPLMFSCTGHATHPPPYFNESTLVKALETAGIGRPSTYANIVDKLYDKGYVVKGAAPQTSVRVTNYSLIPQKSAHISSESSLIVLGGKDNDRMIPSSLGTRIIEYLDNVVPYLLEKTFTASMEDDLDKISIGTLQKEPMLHTFYARFHASVDACISERKNIRANASKTPKKAEIVKAPQKILRDFSQQANVIVVETRFGPALFTNGRFVSVTPYLKWRELTLEEVQLCDIKFLLSLPLAHESNPAYTIDIGRYGLYIKDGSSGKNIKMTAAEKDAVYEKFTCQ